VGENIMLATRAFWLLCNLAKINETEQTAALAIVVQCLSDGRPELQACAALELP
jgi:hypothetical protein